MPSKAEDQMSTIDFLPWNADGALPECRYRIGAIEHRADGPLWVELHRPDASGQVQVQLVFEAPLAVRVVHEASLLEYWNDGVVIGGHNVLITRTSKFLDWLEQSSGGVHRAPQVKHFAVLSDDVCLEVLSIEEPALDR
jgi:hypothetical protein